MAHEIVHELGSVPACAPHARAGHVVDSTRDLMFPVLALKTPVLDVENDDYFLARRRGCPDLSQTPYLELHGPLLRTRG